MLAIMLASHPSKPALVYSIFDATYGLGATVGPVLCALLFDLFGFLLPFLVCGCALLFSTLVSYPQVRPISREAAGQLAEGGISLIYSMEKTNIE